VAINFIEAYWMSKGGEEGLVYGVSGLWGLLLIVCGKINKMAYGKIPPQGKG
jgi:hypothetical protein